MYLTKRKDGSYIPYDDVDYEESKKIPIGDVLKASQPRNYKHHKKAFALLKTGFDNQEKYGSFEIYRKVMTILAGYYDQVESKRGGEYIPHSLNYESMGQIKFNKWYEDTMQVVADDLGISVYELENEI